MDIVSYLLGKQAGGGDTPTPSGDYFGTISSGSSNVPGILSSIKTIPVIEVSGTSLNYAFRNCSNLTTIPLINTSSITKVSHMFDSCTSLTSIPQLDTSNVTNFTYMFYNCSSLTTIPKLDTSSASDLSDMFASCFSFNNDTLKNILDMCINAKNGNYVPKTLEHTGLSSSYNARVQNLSNYQDFLNAGWSLS